MTALASAPNIWNWNSRKDIAVGSQQPIAVHMNSDGDIVVCQKSPWDDEDAFILVRPENAQRLVDAILAAAGIEAAPKKPPVNGVTASGVTRDADEAANDGTQPLLAAE